MLFFKDVMSLLQFSKMNGLCVYSALPKIIKTGFAAINLIYFFTAGPDEVYIFLKFSFSSRCLPLVNSGFWQELILRAVYTTYRYCLVSDPLLTTGLSGVTTGEVLADSEAVKGSTSSWCYPY